MSQPETRLAGGLDYTPGDGYDEMAQADGQPRPHWLYLANALEAMGAEELQHRRVLARQMLRDNGVTYHVHGDPTGVGRPWELDPIPLPISSQEWNQIERGLIQRAELLNLLLADLYGAGEVFRQGVLPAELIYAHPGFLRACHRIEPAQKHYLVLHGIDLARATDGTMWVLGDRTQAPPGAGYALENRMVVQKALPSLFRDARVHRLALFFRTLRSTLRGLAFNSSDPRVVVLSSGPHSETYFEHAYLAKYLGLPLVQGADLIVREDRVHMKTLDGLQPVHVILRLLDDRLCDPLELSPDSYLGVPGLAQAARMKHVAIANPLGSGVLENPALAQFMPALARYFLGEDLHLPMPKTWWCGLPTEREHVLANLDTLVIRHTVVHPANQAVRGAALSAAQREELRARIRAAPHLYAGQEEIARSTTPVFEDGRLQARRMVLRAFLTATDTGYLVMPGGLARAAKSPDEWVISLESGGISKDTWVIASEAEKQDSLLAPSGQFKLIPDRQGELPSRVAENLFWLGRYAERGEGIIRLLRTVLSILRQPSDYATPDSRACFHSLLRAVTELTETRPGFVGKGAEERLAAPESELLSVFLDKTRAGGLAYNLNALLYAADAVRERISPDIWRVFNEISENLQMLQAQRQLLLPSTGSGSGEAINKILTEAMRQLDDLVTVFAAFTGLSIESMSHGHGWRFLMIGRRLERAQQMVHLFRATLTSIPRDQTMLLEYLLMVCDSVMTYRRRYHEQAQPQPLLDVLAQDEANPRALGYQLDSLLRHVHDLPRNDDAMPYKNAEERLALEALNLLRLSRSEELAQADASGAFRPALDQLLERLSQLLPLLSDALTNSYFSHAEAPTALSPTKAEDGK